MKGQAEILARFDELGLQYELYEHPPIMVIGDRDRLGLSFGGAVVCKNLLLTTRNKSRFLLLMVQASKTVDLKAVAKAMGTSRLCFASDEDIFAILGQKPGYVGVSGVINDRAHKAAVLFDRELALQKRVAMHPGENTKTVVMPFSSILAYVKHCGAPVDFIDIPG